MDKMDKIDKNDKNENNEKKVPTLFEINFNTSLISFMTYEYIIHDLMKLYSLVLVYYVLSNSKNLVYLFDVQNTIVLTFGIIAYHLVFSRIISFKFHKILS